MKQIAYVVLLLALPVRTSGQSPAPLKGPAPQHAALGEQAVRNVAGGHAPGSECKIFTQNTTPQSEAPQCVLQRIQYQFPNRREQPGARNFRLAYAEIAKMLAGKQALDLKRAIFLTENAWLDNRLPYEGFCQDLRTGVEIIKTAIAQAGYDTSSPLARKWMLQKFMADTIVLKNEKGEPILTHLPFQYDFEDPFGKKDWSKQFVTKLLRSRKGQCHSLPLLYLILAEELGTEAWLTYSPGHQYIKVQNGKGDWFNYETTNGFYSSDAWVLSSGFVKAEAIKSGIYLDTLSKREVVAACLADLAKGYTRKFGYDSFVEQCASRTLEEHPNNIYALQVLSDYHTLLADYVLRQLDYPASGQLQTYPEACALLRARDDVYQRIDQLGFEPIPDEVYKSWLQSFETQKGKQTLEVVRP